MQRAILLNLSCLGCVFRTIAVSNPTNQVIDLITNLQNTMIAKADASQKIYNEFSIFCRKREQQLRLDVTAKNSQAKDLTAQIKDGKATIVTNDRREGREANDISQSKTDADKATKIRQKETEQFKAEEKSLMEMIGMLKRAKRILEKQASKGNPSMIQLQGVSSFATAMSAMVQASLCSSEDAQRLTELLQMHHEVSDSAEDETSAPASTAYQGTTGGIIGMMSELLNKAEKQLEEIRTNELKAQGNYKTLMASLGHEISNSQDDKASAHTRKAKAGEEKAIDEGDLGMTVNDVRATVKTLADLRKVCVAKVQEFTAMTKSRGEEIDALAQAKKVISESVSGAAQSVYGADNVAKINMSSFVQIMTSTNSRATSKALQQVLQQIHDLARQESSLELSQLLSRLKASIRASVQNGEDPFAQVVGMITDMIARLQKEATADADRNAYCEKEMGKTQAKKAEHSDKVEALNTQVDRMSARSMKLKKEVAALQTELAEIAAAQAQMDKIRGDENAEFSSEKGELDKGLQGIQVALKTLREYYGKNETSHQRRANTASNIITLLETIEGDFSKSLAELMAAEQSAITEYSTQTQDNEKDKSEKTVEIDSITKEFTTLDKSVSDSQGDISNVQNELNAVLDYLSKLKKECFIKKDTLEERIQKRQAEIAGLKEALNILETETALLQKSTHRSFQRSKQHFLG